MLYDRFGGQAALDPLLAPPYFKAFLAHRVAEHPDPVASMVITSWRAMA
jgi:hypothetical protein